MAGIGVSNSFDISAADGVTTVFTYTFFAYDASHVKIYSVLNDVETPITTGLTITPNNNYIGGTVTFTTAPASAVGKILRRREVPNTQTTEFTDLVRYKETSMERALNLLEMQIQQIAAKVDLGLRYTEAAGVTSPIIETPVDGYAPIFDGTTGRLKIGFNAADIGDAQTNAEIASDKADEAATSAATAAAAAALFTKATQAEAEAGTENTHYMTALRTAQAIATLASNAVKLVASGTFSAASSVNFTNLGGYKNYTLFLNNLTDSSGGANTFLRLSTDNGASFLSSAGYYDTRTMVYSTVGVTVTGSNASQIALGDTDSSNETSIAVELFGMNTANNIAGIRGSRIGRGDPRFYAGGTNNVAGANFNAFSFYPAAGTISGSYKLYGWN